MEYILKVSPKGQVTLPKKLRERLSIKTLLEIEIRDDQGIFRKSGEQTEALAGSLRPYYLKKKIPLNKAREQASRLLAHEIASKDN
jgi:AbrB family looped-hinge helix DNA binding protein